MPRVWQSFGSGISSSLGSLMACAYLASANNIMRLVFGGWYHFYAFEAVDDGPRASSSTRAKLAVLLVCFDGGQR